MTLTDRYMELDDSALLVADALNQLGLGPWKVRRDAKRTDQWRIYTHIDGPKDLSVHISVEDRDGDGADARWHMRGYRTRDNKYISGGKRNETLSPISVAADRPAMAVAKELMRRLLPQAYELLIEMAAIDARDAEYARQLAQMRDFIIERLDGTPLDTRLGRHQRQPGDYYLIEDGNNAGKRLIFALGNYRDVDITWRVESVDISVSRLPPEIAMSILAVLGSYARAQRMQLEATNA